MNLDEYAKLRIETLEKRIDKCEKALNSDEFKEYRRFIAKTNDFIKGNKIHGIDYYEFPKLNGKYPKQVFAATKCREGFVIANKERFENLTEKFKYGDRFNWKLLHEMRVTPQEYVVLFSSDAGDIYARGINDCFDDEYEYIPGSREEYAF